MDDKLIEKEFEIWIVKPTKGDEKTFADKYHGSYPAMGFYAGFRAAGRMAKIEVLEKLYKYYNMEAGALRHLDIKRDNLLYDINEMISELMAGQ